MALALLINGQGKHDWHACQAGGALHRPRPRKKGGYTPRKVEGCWFLGQYTRRSGTVAVVCGPFNPLQHGVGGVEWGGDAVRSAPPPPPAKQKETVENGHGPGTPPPLQVGEAEVSSPAAPVIPRQQPRRPEGQSGLSCGALTHGKGANAKKSWKGKGDECHC